MRKYTYFAGFLVAFLATFLTATCLIYKNKIGPVSDDATLKEVVIDKGATFLTIGSILKEQNLIKSEKIYKIYVKLMHPEGLQAGVYKLSESMGIDKIVSILESGNAYNADTITITFVEGLNMRKIAEIISNNTNNTTSDVFNLLSDEQYLDELIDKYWFITKKVKNKSIYYSLEGYLFPDTYEFNNKNVTVKEIFSKMLDNMANKINDYKQTINNSKYTFDELLTLASIVELEASNSDDRYGVAGVFYNRLENNWSLGSDVTTYYASKVDMSERDLTWDELNDVNAYNTRSASMAGKLPVGPICNPSFLSIKAALEPTKHNYFYFVSDKNHKTYFNVDEAGHQKTIRELRETDLWYQY